MEDVNLHDITAQRIRECRAKQKLSGQTMADLIGIAQTNISRYERGIKRPSFKTLRKISEVLSVSTDYLMGLTDDPHGHSAPTTIAEPAAELPETPRPVSGASILEHATTLRRELKENIYQMDQEDMQFTRDVLDSCVAMIDSLTDTEKQAKTAG